MAPIPPTILVLMFLMFGVLGLMLASGRVGTPRDDLWEWQWLAERYTATERPKGDQLLGQVHGFGAGARLAKGVDPVRLVLGSSGLYLEAPFRHHFRRLPPLLIPWSDIQFRAERTFLWVNSFELRVGGTVYLRVSRDAWEAIEPYLARSAPR